MNSYKTKPTCSEESILDRSRDDPSPAEKRASWVGPALVLALGDPGQMALAPHFCISPLQTRSPPLHLVDGSWRGEKDQVPILQG